MAQYASLLSVNISLMYLWSKFDDSASSGYLETELNATGEWFAFAHKGSRSRGHECTRRILHKPIFALRSYAKMLKMHNF